MLYSKFGVFFTNKFIFQKFSNRNYTTSIIMRLHKILTEYNISAQHILPYTTQTKYFWNMVEPIVENKLMGLKKDSWPMEQLKLIV